MSFSSILKDIKNLKIQGASNVARAGAKALALYSANSKAKTRSEFVKDLRKAKKMLFATRPTEPAMHNFIRSILFSVETSGVRDPKALKGIVESSARDIIRSADEDKKTLMNVGAGRLPDKCIIMTHCHSSTVTGVIKRAKEMGKKIEVFCTETRPLYQGRLTAKELLKAGIKTTMIVDSGMMLALKKSDIVLLGADAIFSEGSCVNKIGSSMAAFLANELEVPFFVCSTTWKFAPSTLNSRMSIEKRDEKEVWPAKPKKLKILNPSFDVLDRQLINGIITEFGVLSPESVYPLLREKRSWMV